MEKHKNWVLAGQNELYALWPEVSSPPGSGVSAMAQTKTHTSRQQTDIADIRLNRPNGRFSENSNYGKGSWQDISNIPVLEMEMWNMQQLPQFREVKQK